MNDVEKLLKEILKELKEINSKLYYGDYITTIEPMYNDYKVTCEDLEAKVHI